MPQNASIQALWDNQSQKSHHMQFKKSSNNSKNRVFCIMDGVDDFKKLFGCQKKVRKFSILKVIFDAKASPKQANWSQSSNQDGPRSLRCCNGGLCGYTCPLHSWPGWVEWWGSCPAMPKECWGTGLGENQKNSDFPLYFYWKMEVTVLIRGTSLDGSRCF